MKTLRGWICVMMDLLVDREIPSHPTVEDCREGLGNLEKVFGIKLS